ncbi:MAG TPA: Clp protease ClpP [Clostridiales bacterium]|nr:Clp protease ClpP [Clostridiales bacterium]
MELYLNGTIYDNESAEVLRYFGFSDLCCPADIEAGLKKAGGEDVTVYINSPGGDLLAGMQIYSMLRAYKGGTTARIQSMAASAASVAMQGCRRVICEAPALVCIHDPTMATDGTAAEHRHTARQLENVKEAIINAYMVRAKKSREEIAALMSRDIWMPAQMALEYGIIDEIDGEVGELSGDGVATFVNARTPFLLPTAKMVEEYRQHVAAEKKAMEEKDRQKRRMLALLELYSKI